MYKSSEHQRLLHSTNVIPVIHALSSTNTQHTIDMSIQIQTTKNNIIYEGQTSLYMLLIICYIICITSHAFLTVVYFLQYNIW